MKLGLIAIVISLGGRAATLVTISNSEPRVDVKGAILDAHDGKMWRSPDGTYYWYAASYGSCLEPAGDTGCSGAAPGSCGFQLNHNVTLYTSRDLKTWKNHGPVLRMQDIGLQNAVMFCPKVIFNELHQKFVLWFNWISGSDFSNSYYAVATSSSAFGPFELVVRNVTTLAFADTGDFNLMQDDDGDAYIVYTSHIVGFQQTHRMSIEKLSPDYLGTLGSKASSGFFGDSWVEAPALFKRQGIYYAVFGSCCCYCKEGSAVSVYTAISPLGPFAKQNQIGFMSTTCSHETGRAAILSKQQSEMSAMCDSGTGVGAQMTDIFPWIDAAGVEQFMYIGDRWQSSPDGIKGHDFTYWYPLSFTTDGNVTDMKTVNSFSIDIEGQDIVV